MYTSETQIVVGCTVQHILTKDWFIVLSTDIGVEKTYMCRGKDYQKYLFYDFEITRIK